MYPDSDDGRAGDFAHAKDELTDKLQQAQQTATSALHDAGDAIQARVGDYAGQAKDALADQAAGAQRNVSLSLSTFSDALRAASEHLANNQQRGAAKFVLDAAGGLERLAGSIKDKPFEEVLQDVREFGRGNSSALVAGSVLAGLALGRFIKSSTPNSDASAQSPGPERAPDNANQSDFGAFSGAS